MGRLAIIINKDDNYNAVNRILNAINHPEIAKIERIFEGTAKKELTTGYSHVLLVGTEMIKKYLGAGVAGRNAVIQLDNVWYFTMPNPAALYTQSVAVRAANQVIRAIQSLDNPNFYLPKIPKYEINTYAELEQLVNECLNSEFMSFDFETNNMLQTRHPDFAATCLGICFTPGFSWIIPQWMLYDKSCLVQLKRIFCDQKLTKIAHNLSFDYKVLKRLGITPKGRYSCTKILSWLIDENTPNGLKEAVDWYLPDFSGYDYHVDFSKDVDQDLYEYLAIDAHVTLCLYCIFIKELSKDQALYVAFRNIYMPSLFVLAEMEWGGCFVDKDYLDIESARIENLITQRVNEIQEMPEVQGWVISKNKELVAEAIQELTDKIATRKLKFTNPDDRYILDWTDKIKKYKSGELYCIDSCDVNSPKVLAELLYTKNGFNFPNPMREDKGAKGKKKVESNSTDKDALNDIDHPIGQKLRAIRTLEKMNGTYYKGISELVIDGKIYANFNQTGTVTARLCVHGSTLITTDQGLLKIKDIVDNKIQCNVLTHLGNWKPILNWYNKGEERMFKVHTNSTQTIICTAEHKFLTYDSQWKSLKEIYTSREGSVKVMVDDGSHKLTNELLMLHYIVDYGESTVYDIEVADDHSFISNGIVSHNSSSNPNLQNIPTRVSIDDTEVKAVIKGVKKAFYAPEGYVVMQADLSQAELRIIAHLSKDENMINAYREGKDLHAITGSRIARMQDDFMGFLESSMFKENRQIAKCFHPDTEVLTKRGWVRIVDLSDGEQVMQALPKSMSDINLEWVTPIEVFTKPNEFSELVHLKNESIDLRVTPDHLLLAYHKNEFTLTMPEQLNRKRGFISAGDYLGGSINIDEYLLRASVITQADGSYSGFRVRFGFTKKRKIERFRSFFKLEDYHESLSKQGVTTFTLTKDMSVKIQGLLDGKDFPWWWLNLTKDCRLAVLDEAAYWDSHTNTKLTCYIYSNTHSQSVDVLQAVAHLTGRKAQKRSDKRKKELHHQIVHKLSIKNTDRTRGGNITTKRIAYGGDVACLSVPSGFVLVRDNGIALIQKQSANFGLVYDISLDGYIAYIKAQTGKVITKADAQLHFDSVFGSYPNLKKWHQQYKDIVAKDGFVRNLFGVKRRLPEVWSSDQQKVSAAMRLAINTPVQGTIGLWAQWLMIWLKLRLPSSVMIWSTVHDSIVLYVPTDMVEEVSEVIKELETEIPTQLYFDMETLAVPLKMDIEVGDSYGNLSEIKK